MGARSIMIGQAGLARSEGRPSVGRDRIVFSHRRDRLTRQERLLVANLPRDHIGLPKPMPQRGPPLPGDLAKSIANAGAPP